MKAEWEEVRLFLGLNWLHEEGSLISVDTNEEEWYHLMTFDWMHKFVVSIVVDSSLVSTGSIRKFITY